MLLGARDASPVPSFGPFAWPVGLLPKSWRQRPWRRRPGALTVGLLLVAAFDVTFGQSPLYSGNQNTYLLSPLAQAGLGDLARDWMANTADRMPTTSLLVRETVEHIGRWPLHLYQAVLMGLYLLALVGLAVGAMRRVTPGRLWMLLALVFVGHVNIGLSSVFRGSAGQSVLFEVFEPALFGVFLVVSLLLFAAGRFLPAAACLAVAATAHPTYLLTGAIFAALYAAVVWRREGRPRLALAVIALFGLLTAPIAVYTLITFAPQSAEVHARATAILADERIPYHADPAVWLNLMDAARIALVVGAAVVARRSRLAPVLLGGLIVGIVLTAARVVFDSRDLGLLFPWRVSVALVPVSTAILLGAAVDRVLEAAALRGLRREWVIAVAAAIGMAAMTGLRMDDLVEAVDTRARSEEPLTAWVSTHRRPGDVFLLPVATRLADIGQWEGFRLATGAPIYVDLKTHPLRDGDVLEWWGRVQRARRLYAAGFPACSGIRELSRTAGVTAVVVSSRARPAAGCSGLELVRRGAEWSVYRILPVGGSPTS